MRAVAIALTILALPPQEGALTFERTVRLTFVDTLNRRREVHRKERVAVKGGNLAVIDLTFGERLVVRADQKKILKIDGAGGAYSEYTFDEASALRKAALDEIAAAKARVPGTPDEKELDAILEGFDRFAQAPSVELKASNSTRQLLVNGDRMRLSAQVDEKVRSPNPYSALARAGAFPPEVAAKLEELGGLPLKGTVRYVLFLDRVIEEFEVTSVKAGEAADSDFELPPGLVKTPLRGFERPSDAPKKDAKKP